MSEPELDKSFKLDNESLADFLIDIADSLKEDETLKLDGKEWNLIQPVNDGDNLMRLIRDEEGLEVSFKL
ncbi:MAG: hypothetical protein BRC27_02425 [Nanohaloarchaea archaeon SW_10_44_10]|nr:MAG: hypothetical protein BRC27_02425 [Nanohaloarchaea archaeon SW_10_44_10]